MAYVSKVVTTDGSQYDLKSTKTAAIPFGKIDSTSTSTAFTATVDGITELYDGVCCFLMNGVVTSASGWTLNINGLGAKPAYSTLSASTRSTTGFNVSYTYLFVYNTKRVSGGCWDIYYGYDSNTNTIGYQIRTNNMTMPVSGATYRYRLLFTSADGTKWVPANTSTSTNATASRTVTQTPIDPFGSIVYYGSTTTVSSGSSPSTSYLWRQYNITLGYSFNTTGAALTLTNKHPVYIKCAPQSDGSAIIDSSTPYVQALPSTEDGKIYIYLGHATDATTVEITVTHPIYYYKDGAIRFWVNPPAAGSTITVDNYIDTTLQSENPVQNKVIASALDDLADDIDKKVQYIALDESSDGNDAVILTATGIGFDDLSSMLSAGKFVLFTYYNETDDYTKIFSIEHVNYDSSIVTIVAYSNVNDISANKSPSLNYYVVHMSDNNDGHLSGMLVEYSYEQNFVQNESGNMFLGPYSAVTNSSGEFLTECKSNSGTFLSPVWKYTKIEQDSDGVTFVSKDGSNDTYNVIIEDGIVTIPDLSSFWTANSVVHKSYVDGKFAVFWAVYGTTTSAQIEAAYQAGKEVLCYYSNRIYRLAYRSSSTNHTFIYGYSTTIYRVQCNSGSWSNASTELQGKITVSGILKSNSSGTISAATAGTDYLAPSAIANMQTTTNLVTSVSSSSTDSQYPSAKLFYDTIGDIETLLAAI